MKKLLLVCCFLVGISAVSYAQRQASTPAQDANVLRNELDLNADQTAKITVIYEEQAKAIASATAAAPAPAAPAGGGRGAGFAPSPAVTAARTASEAKIKALLTPEQALTFQYHVDQQRGGRRGN